MSETKVFLFYSENDVMKAVLAKRKNWKFNIDQNKQNDLIFRVHKEIRKTFTQPSRFIYTIICAIASKCKLFKHLNHFEYKYMPKTYLSFREFKKSGEIAKANGIYKKSRSSCGMGVEIIDDLRHLKNMIIENKTDYVIQQHITTPMLYHGNKFDLRVYLYIDSFGNLYLYQIFGVRSCQIKYDKNSKNKQVQLTNVAQGAKIFPSTQWKSEKPWGIIYESVKIAVTDLAHILVKCQKKSRENHQNQTLLRYALLGCDFMMEKQCCWRLMTNPPLNHSLNIAIGNIHKKNCSMI